MIEWLCLAARIQLVDSEFPQNPKRALPTLKMSSYCHVSRIAYLPLLSFIQNAALDVYPSY